MCCFKKAAQKSAKTVGKDSGCETRAYIVSIDRKTTIVYGLKAVELRCLKNACQLSIAMRS